MSTGYSGTPLAKKLGLKNGYKTWFHNIPEHYFDLFTDLPAEMELIEAPGKEECDFVHIFCSSFDELQQLAQKSKDSIKKNGLLWVSWPKGKSGIPTDLKRDMIREYFIELGMVDVKVAAVDELWSGLKFVYRKEDR